MFSSHTAWHLEDVREMVAMQSVYFIEKLAQGVVIIGSCFTNDCFHNTFLSSSKSMVFDRGWLTC
jgi:hypothetical protein